MRRLILVRHSLPEADPETPASQWRLSEDGRARCSLLADSLAPYRPGLVFSSGEPKARETADIVAGRLVRRTTVVDGLHEHERSSVGFLGTREFEEAVTSLFARPTELVLGDETARQAEARFSRAIESILGEHRENDIVVVTHGTVVALFASRVAEVEPLQLWRRLEMPSYVVLSVPDLKLLDTVERVV